MAEKMKPSGIDWIGDIPNEWDITKVKYRTSQIGSGTTPDSGNPLYYEDGCFPWIQSGDLYNADYIRDTEKKITELAVADFNALTWYEKEFVVVAMYGASVGNIAISQISSYTNQACCVLKAKDDDLRYLFYFLSAGKENMLQMAFGGTQPNISQAIIKNLPYLDVSHNEQQAIADFLGKECAQIDSIAADLEKQIALLQQYKKSLITETVTKGLDKSVPMKDSGVEWIGEIPEHWEISRVRHLASLCSGATPSKDVLSYWEGNIPWVSSQEVKSDIIKDTSLHISEEAINSCSTQLMPAGTLVMVVRSGILQHTIPVALLGVPATINQDIKAFQFNHLMLPAYFKYYIQGENDALLSVIIKDKTTVESVDNQLLLSLKIMVPPIEEQKAIVAFLNYKCGYIDKILNDKQEQLNLLMQHKKSLIYEYVTGKKRVKEVQ